ncbi:MAG: hypothetical protein P8L68_15490 [Paracoccaceae bacterium]|nr:hypothetical protein [Paracoccaceae bacterium]MDG2259886.1 hypothetical protein [Paracoccaceae bacterium]
MALIETETEKSRLTMAIQLAEGQLDDLTALAASLLEEIKAGDVDAVKSAVKTAEELRRLVKLAIDLEARHERDRKRDAGYSGSYGLDLDKARSDIRCKLGRLRTCCQSGDVSK